MTAAEQAIAASLREESTDSASREIAELKARLRKIIRITRYGSIPASARLELITSIAKGK